MAAGRKLQAEVEKLLKKVDEGIEEFNDVWGNVHNATHANQREKFEAELKTQIKKLQRGRDQIKTWQSDKAVKNKNPLEKARKSIEVEMERFKEFERDAKTKTFSKEGLSKSDKVDPHEAERSKHRDWIQDAIDKLNAQIDELEAELKAKAATPSNKKKKDKAPPVDDAVTAHTRHVQKTHRWHVTKLEQLLRNIDNDEIVMKELDELKESVDYYIEDNGRAEDEYLTLDSIYEAFGLEEVQDYLTKDKDRSDSMIEGEKEQLGQLSKESSTRHAGLKDLISKLAAQTKATHDDVVYSYKTELREGFSKLRSDVSERKMALDDFQIKLRGLAAEDKCQRDSVEDGFRQNLNNVERDLKETAAEHGRHNITRS